MKIKAAGNRARLMGNQRMQIVSVIAAVAVTIAYTWKKVELTAVAQSIAIAHDRIESMQQEKTQLAASIAMKKRPGNIKDRAQGQLGMIYPTTRVIDLVIPANRLGLGE